MTSKKGSIVDLDTYRIRAQALKSLADGHDQQIVEETIVTTARS